MAIPKNKDELLKVLESSYSKLRMEILEIPESLSRKKTIHGDVSVCDVLAYQIGWGNLFLSWYAAGKKNEIPAMPREGYKWNELGKLAQKFYSEHQMYIKQQLLSIFEKTFNEILEIVQKEQNSSLYCIGVYAWTGDKWPLGRWINVNTSSPYQSALAKIRKWKKAEGLI